MLTLISGAFALPHLSTLETSAETRAIETVLNGGNLRSIKTQLDQATESFQSVDKLRLPPFVQALVDKGDGVTLDEKSIDKARGILNGLIQAAQKELDAKTLECKEFRQRNREISGQVKTDLARLGEQITYLKGVEAEANSGIADADAAVTKIEEEMAQEQEEFDKIRLLDQEEMTWRENDLRVAEFILRLTKCKTSFLESNMFIRDCDGEKGHFTRFDNEQWHMATLSMRTQARRMVEKALYDSTGPFKRGMKRLKNMLKRKGKGKKGTPIKADPVKGSSAPASARKQANKCVTGKPNCGLLHDNMSLMWGEMKDAVDRLNAQMRKNADAFRKKNENWNAQIQMHTTSKTTHGQSLAEASSNIAADGEEQVKKEQEDRRIEAEYKKVWGECVASMKEILFTKICGVKKVRGELHKKSTKVKPTDMIDCDVGDWVAHECSVPCDDELVGGTQIMTREIIQKKNEFGTECPSIEESIKCGQFPCPVDCKMSSWGEYSACSKDCGGGIKTRSRTKEVTPRNGGKLCDVPTETVTCNSGSCDRDCELTSWKLRPCNVACGGGYKVRKKHVKKPARANGKCPTKRSMKRYGKHRCNEQACYGDEECVAKQDVVIAVDGSGSLTDKGFAVLRDFTANLVARYRGEVEEPSDEPVKSGKEPKLIKVPGVQVGVVQFGNGVLADDGTVSPATIDLGISNDIGAATAAIEALTWKKGFTNMAQALTAADSVFMNGGRKSAQSVVILITDGKPSFHFQTKNAVDVLRHKGVKVMVIAIKSFLSEKEKVLLKSMVSKPSNTNFIHVPGLKQLAHPEIMDAYVGKALIHSCPKTVSIKQENEAKEAVARQKEVESLAKDVGA